FTVRSSVTVGHVPAPEIRSFRPALSPIAFAAGTHLFWSIIGADRVSIDRGIGSVTPGNGGARVTPKSTTTYTLRAEAGAPSGPESCVSERTATVQVENIDITHF